MEYSSAHVGYTRLLHCTQAVNLLHEEVASQPEEACGDMLVLPIYAALPPELQASMLPLSNPVLKSQPLLTA